MSGFTPYGMQVGIYVSRWNRNKTMVDKCFHIIEQVVCPVVDKFHGLFLVKSIMSQHRGHVLFAICRTDDETLFFLPPGIWHYGFIEEEVPRSVQAVPFLISARYPLPG